jgi:hypothetical protein
MSFIRRYILGRQEGSITLAAGVLTDFVDFTVINADYISIEKRGVFYASSSSSQTLNIGYLTFTKLSATSIRVTATRLSDGGGAGNIHEFSVLDLNPLFIKSIQRGQGSEVITAVDPDHCVLHELGAQYSVDSVDGAPRWKVSLTDTTHVDQTLSGGGTADVSWELIEHY